MERNAKPLASAWATRLVGAVLCLAVAAIHVVDQGGIPGTISPYYVGVGYHVLEIAAVVAAGLLLVLARLVRPGWLLAVGVAASLLTGYILSKDHGQHRARRYQQHRDQLPSDGVRIAVFYTKIYNQLLVPLTAADQLQAPPDLRQALRTLDRHVDDYITRARLSPAA